jgi:beta-galactosidase
VRRYFTTGYREQIDSSLQPLFEDNIDAALINIAHAKLDYKLLVVPADFVMDAASADAIRSYVRDGGTVVMTAFSAKG